MGLSAVLYVFSKGHNLARLGLEMVMHRSCERIYDPDQLLAREVGSHLHEIGFHPLHKGVSTYKGVLLDILTAIGSIFLFFIYLENDGSACREQYI